MTKYLTTLCLIAGGVIPLIVDISPSHLLNPSWEPHARLHEVWRLSTNTLIFSLGIYLLWIKKREVLSAIMSLCILAGFVIAEMLMPLYDGDTVSLGVVEPEILHIPIGVFMFYSAFIIQIFTLSLLRHTQAKLKDL